MIIKFPPYFFLLNYTFTLYYQRIYIIAHYSHIIVLNIHLAYPNHIYQKI